MKQAKIKQLWYLPCSKTIKQNVTTPIYRVQIRSNQRLKALEVYKNMNHELLWMSWSLSNSSTRTCSAPVERIVVRPCRLALRWANTGLRAIKQSTYKYVYLLQNYTTHLFLLVFWHFYSYVSKCFLNNRNLFPWVPLVVIVMVQWRLLQL